uniref:RxLR effector candidate protein n=1 Tax=Macrostomum lignano TaxID=282301 RepID=A0A1I8FIP5_9PLAT
MFYWKLLAVRLAFVIVFESTTGVLQSAGLLDILIPDVPEVLQVKIKREQYLAKQALMDAGDFAEPTAATTKTDAEALVRWRLRCQGLRFEKTIRGGATKTM